MPAGLGFRVRLKPACQTSDIIFLYLNDLSAVPARQIIWGVRPVRLPFLLYMPHAW